MSYKIKFRETTHDDGFAPDPTVTVEVDGTHDVSRLVNLFHGGLVEHLGVAERMAKKLRRYSSGRAALRLLAEHGGADLSVPDPQPIGAVGEVMIREFVRDVFTAPERVGPMWPQDVHVTDERAVDMAAGAEWILHALTDPDSETAPKMRELLSDFADYRRGLE